MDRRALEEARRVLDQARRQLNNLRDMPLEDEQQSIWEYFLIDAHKSILKLYRGAQAGPAKGVADGVKHKHSNDPMLSYLLHARNSDTHGLERNTAVEGEFVPLSPGSRPEVKFLSLEIVDEQGRRRDVDVSADQGVLHLRMRLVPVTDRGIVYVPATRFEGRSIDGADPLVVGQLYVDWIERILDQVSAFVK